MAGFILLWSLGILPLAILMKLTGEKPKVFLICAGFSLVPSFIVFAIAFPHVLLRGF